MPQRSLKEIRKDFAEEMDRLHASDLSTFESFSASVAFHLGFLNATVYELLARVERLEQQSLNIPRVIGGD
jgi:hypothetical protein